MHEQTASPSERSQLIGDQARELLRWLAPQLLPHLAGLGSEPTGTVCLSALERLCANGDTAVLLLVTVLVEAQRLRPPGPGVLPLGAAGLAPCALDPETVAGLPGDPDRSVIRWVVRSSKN